MNVGEGVSLRYIKIGFPKTFFYITTQGQECFMYEFKIYII